MNKELLREYKKRERDLLKEDERRTASNIIFKSVIDLLEYSKADTVMSFVSFGSEVDTLPLLKKVLLDNKKLLLPRMETLNGKRVLGVYEVSDLSDELIKNSYGILEPDPFKSKPFIEKKIDLIICPGVVFDKNCNRIGYGAGYYDRFLSNPCCAASIKIGLAYDIQVVDSIIPDDYDIPMDKIITESRKIYIPQ